MLLYNSLNLHGWRSNVVALIGSFLETTLTQTSSTRVNAVVDMTGVDATKSAVFAAGFSALAAGTPAEYSLLMEVGSKDHGAAAYFDDTNRLIVRFGNGNGGLVDGWQTDTAYAIYEADAIAGKGNLIVEFNIGEGDGIRVWWLDTLLVPVTSDAGSGITAWSTTNDGKWLGGTSDGGPGGDDYGTPGGDPFAGPPAYGTASPLRAYTSGQVIPPPPDTAYDYLAPVLSIAGLQFVGGPSVAYQSINNTTTTPSLVGDPVGTLANRMTSGGLVMRANAEGNRPALVNVGGELLVQGGGDSATVHLASTAASAHADALSFDIMYAVLIPTSTTGGALWAPHGMGDQSNWRWDVDINKWSNPKTVILDSMVFPATPLFDTVGVLRIRAVHDASVPNTAVTIWLNGGDPILSATLAAEMKPISGMTILISNTNGASAGTDASMGNIVYVSGTPMTLTEANAASDWIVSELNSDPRSGAMT